MGSEKKNDSVEQGIFIDHKNKLIHGCKVRHDLGCGLTRCGRRFIIGDVGYRVDGVFGEPPKENSDGEYSKCQWCTNNPNFERTNLKWVNWKTAMVRTLRHIKSFENQRQSSSHIVDQADSSS